MSPKPPPLQGIRVIEFGNLVAAPYCGMLLADLGADVIKVEPIAGDLARQIGPFYGDESGFFLAVNRGKRSVAVDAKDDRIKRLLWTLCSTAHVVLHNLRRGAMERIGLGGAELVQSVPGLVYAVITAFGTEGPDADRAGIDLIFQGESGMMSITGGDGDPPRKTATTIADFVAGTNAALAISAALVSRRGGVVEVSLRDSLIAVQAGWNAQFFASGRQPSRTGTASPVTGPNQTFRCADGYFNLAVVSDRHFQKVCSILGLDSTASDPRFSTNPDRVANRDELTEILETVLIEKPSKHWLEVFARAGLPVGRLLDLNQVFSDEQVIYNEMVTEIDHPRAGRVRTQGSPLRLDGGPARAETVPPLLGQHTRQILSEGGLPDEEIECLLAAGSALQASAG